MRKKIQVDEQAEARINFLYALEAAASMGDQKTLDDAKRNYPDVYAEWEKFQKERQSE